MDRLQHSFEPTARSGGVDTSDNRGEPATTLGHNGGRNVAGRTFNDDERRHGVRLMSVLECFTEIRGTMPLQYVLAFLLVVMDEGKTVGEYARKAGTGNSVMSRHLLDIGPRARNKEEEGFGLVETRQNLANLREHTVHLTDKGRALYHKIVRRMAA